MMTEESGASRSSRWRNFWSGFNWEETRAGVDRESRARVLLLGLVGAGKSTLFNRLCGWNVSPPAEAAVAPVEPTVEDLGLFCLIDLPEGEGDRERDRDRDRDREGESDREREGFYRDYPASASPLPGNGQQAPDPVLPAGPDPFLLAEGADLLVYVLDGARDVRAADYRWIGRLRRLGLPLVVALNKSDLIPEPALAGRLAEIEQRLAVSVLPISAAQGTNIPTRLLPRMIDACPTLTVALGRELGSFRREAAGRLISRAAFLNSLIALEPVPLVDLPLQIMTLIGLFLRIATLYHRPPTTSQRREVAAAVAGGLAVRFAAQQALKLVPLVGWLASSLIALSSTWLLGQAAVAYFESGGDAAVARRLVETQAGLGRAWQPVRSGWQRWVVRPWQRRPRFAITWGREGESRE